MKIYCKIYLLQIYTKLIDFKFHFQQIFMSKIIEPLSRTGHIVKIVNI